MAGSPVTGDRLSEVLGKSRRRFVLYYLLSNEYTDIDSLSVQIAAWEQGESVTSVDETARRQIKISLHHNHLPRLETNDVVEFDVRSGDVVRTSGFEDVRPAIEQLRETDERLESQRDNEEGTDDVLDGEQFAFNN